MKFVCMIAALFASAYALRVNPTTQPAYNKEEAAACKASRGSYRRDGLMGSYYCIHNYKNAFKPCKSS